MKPETKFRKRVSKFLVSLVPPVYHASIQQKSICGTPDLLCSVRGHFLALEIKSPGFTLSKLQRYNFNKIIESGGMALEINPDNFSEVKELIMELNK